MQPGMGQGPTMDFGKPKKSKAPIVAGVCVVLALAGVGFGVFGMMQNNGKKIEDLKIEIENSDGTKTELETDKITISDDSSVITIKDSAKAGDYTIYRSLLEKYIDWDTFDGDLVSKALNGDIYDPNYVAYVATGAAVTAGIWRDSISTSELTSSSVEYFNKEIEMPSELRIRCAIFNNDGHGSYVNVSGGCGGTWRSRPLFDIASINEKDGTLTITIFYGKMWYGTLQPGGELSNSERTVYEYTKDADCLVGDESSCVKWEDKASEIEKYFYEHVDEFDKYTLTFKKEDRHYYLADSSKVE